MISVTSAKELKPFRRGVLTQPGKPSPMVGPDPSSADRVEDESSSIGLSDVAGAGAFPKVLYAVIPGIC